MSRIAIIAPKFVEFIPKTVEDGILYISEEYGTASHNCACGCGMRVVTPLTPTDWRVTVEGNAVSLFPSIGNHDYPCRSHYWIANGRIEWSTQWSAQRIAIARREDRERKEEYFSTMQRVEDRGWYARILQRVGGWLARLRE